MDQLLPKAAIVATRLRALKHRIAIAESSTGGLLSSALLAMPGASDYFLGGAVVYTQKARQVLLGLNEADLAGMRAATEAYASLAAARMRERFAAEWGLAETGATGPSGNRYGDAPGHCCLAVAGPVARAITLETASGDRVANMRAFAAAGLDLLIETLSKAG